MVCAVKSLVSSFLAVVQRLLFPAVGVTSNRDVLVTDAGFNTAVCGASTKAVSQRGAVIAEQSFDFSAPVWGKATFESYLPAAEGQDVVFVIKNDDYEIELEGFNEENTCSPSGTTFSSVNAVSFPDYNEDGLQDILVICTYNAPDNFYDKQYLRRDVRIYDALENGEFLLNTAISQELSALSHTEIINSVPSALNYLAYKKSGGDNWENTYAAIVHSSVYMPEQWALLPSNHSDYPVLAFCTGNYSGIITYNESSGKMDSAFYQGTISYIPSDDVVHFGGGKYGMYSDVVYQFEQGGLSLSGSGEYYNTGEELNALEYDGILNRYITQHYKWNGEKVDRNTYMKELLSVYDVYSGKEPKFCTEEEILEQIKTWNE